MKNITLVAVLAALTAFGALVACGGSTPAPATPDPAGSAAGMDSTASSAMPAAPATSK